MNSKFPIYTYPEIPKYPKYSNYPKYLSISNLRKVRERRTYKTVEESVSVGVVESFGEGDDGLVVI